MKNLLTTLIFSLFFCTFSGATISVVNNNLNAGPGSLRQAVLDANDGDTILVNVAGTITLLSPIDINGFNGLHVIGPYPAHITITSGGSFNGSAINVLNSQEVYIENIGFVGSNGTANAISVKSNTGNIYVRKCLFEGITFNVDGGAIAVDGSEFYLDHSSFISNSASGNGGAIQVESGSLYAKNNTFAGNSCGGNGGAINFNDNYYGNLMHNTFKENTALSGQVMHSGSGTGIIDLFCTAGDGNGGGIQFDGPVGSYNSLGGNVIKLNGGPDFIPWGFNGGDNAGVVINGFLHVPIVTDGYGLKYYTITNCNSDFVDVDPGGVAGPEEDTRGAPRKLSGNCGIVTGPNVSPIADAGACEYTKLRVLNNDGLVSTNNSLPWCLSQNLDFKNYVEFDGGPMVIDPSVPLNIATTEYIIDGYSQTGTRIPGPEETGNPGVRGAILDIEIRNGSGIVGGIIVNSTSSNSRISGLRITGFDQFGINLVGANNIKIQGNEIGITASGDTDTNGETGILLGDADNTLIGGTHHWMRNVVSGNGGGGGPICNIFIDGSSDQTKIAGNLVGLQSNGLNAVNNPGAGTHGIVNQGTNTRIGLPGPVAGNVISGVPTAGIIEESVLGGLIQNNRIGTNYDGNTAVPNFFGILVQNGANGSRIGGLLGKKTRNIISGNDYGIQFITANNILVEGNYIGTDIQGNNALSPTSVGIFANGACANISIGGTADSSRNVISGNLRGIRLLQSNGNILIANNLIGTDYTGQLPLGNIQEGVFIDGPNVFPTNIGIAGSGNVISGHTGGGVGIRIFNSGTHLIQGNLIGMNSTNDGALGNDIGIEIDSSASIIIGGDFSLYNSNTVSNNGEGIVVHANSTSIVIEGNFVGTDSTGNVDFGNTVNGIRISNSFDVLIGGGTFQTNVISGNDGANVAGIRCENNGATVISHNRIGTNAAGSTAIPNEYGIFVTGDHIANIGGTLGGENYICASNEAGIYVNVPNTQINGNVIGIGVNDETFMMGNGDGIRVDVPNVQIGNLPAASYTNIVSNNVNGINFNSENADFGTIDNCLIGLDQNSNPAGNSNYGINIFQGDTNSIGLINMNRIIGSGVAGINIEGTANDNIIESCEIGDISGTAGAENGIGIQLLNGPSGTLIGGMSLNQGNTIVNCINEGIRLENSNLNTIRSNRIGIDAADVSGANGIGVHLINSNNNTIGGANTTGSEFHNIISYNNGDGILLDASDDNHVYGNFIGMRNDGIGTAPNVDGIVLINNSSFNLIGTSSSNSNESNVISGNSGHGIILDNSTDNDIFLNMIGTDLGGGSPLAAQNIGILLTNGSQNNQIGGIDVFEGNIIKGNITNGIIIEQSPNNNVEGNVIGGSGIQQFGITITGVSSTNNVIGAAPIYTYGNVIVGNASSGIEIVADAFNNTITQNYIGIDPTTNSASGVMTQPVGVYIHSDAGDNNNVGLNANMSGNLISGNDVGVQIEGANQFVYNNWIGLDTTGLSAVPNNVAGVVLTNGANSNQIGNNGSNAPNVISANPIGVYIEGGTTNSNFVHGNNIGMNVNQSDTLANIIGIGIENGANNNYIGSSTAGTENLISGNHHGVMIDNATDNYVRNNRIGTIFHNYFGVTIQNGSTGNYIGGNFSEKNIVVNNDTSGVAINNASANYVLGNYIGVLSDGTTPAGNGIGIYGNLATGNFIGSGSSADYGNIISANTFAGVAFENASNGNFFENNFIGTDYTGNDTTGTANMYGMYFDGCDNNTIGGDWLSGEGNVVAGNYEDGILFFGTTGSYIYGNNIGLSKNNLNFLGNYGTGVRLESGSDGNFIGTTGNGFENIITANYNGIDVEFSANNQIRNNFIGNDDTGGESALPSGVNNQQVGILLDSGAVANIITGKNVISGNALVGIGLAGGGCTNNVVTGNHIGVTFTGNVAYSNDSVNVYIGDGAKFNTIGGSNPADKNIIGGDAVAQVLIEGPGTDSNQVAGNNIGLGFDNNTTYNSDFGVVVDQGNENTIGGGLPGEGNNICDFNENGILIVAATGNQILGNRIGIKPDNSAAPIDSAGVSLRGGDNTWIGAYLPGSDSINVITNCNRGVEIRKTGIANNTYSAVVAGNSIYNNTNQGIDINADDMVLPIDTANNNIFLNNGEIDRCEIISAWNCGTNGNTHIGFKFYASNSLPNYNIQVYTNPTAPDPTGYGEGENYLGNWVFSPATNHDTISIDLGQALPVGTIITASITGVWGNTSEFSEQDTVTVAPPLPTINTVTESCLGANDGQLEIDAPEAYYFSTDGFLTFTYGLEADTLTDLLPGTYNVEAQYLNGCIQAVSVNLPSGNPLDLGYTVIPDTCGQGVGSVVFDTIPTNVSGGSGNYNYSYDNGGSYGTNIGIFGLNTSTYDLVIYDTTLNCYSLPQNVVVGEINDVVDETFYYSDFCQGNIILPDSTETPGGSWSFGPDPGDGAAINPTTGEITNSVVGNSYNVVYTVGQCAESDTVTVTAAPLDDPSFTYTDFCIGTTPSISTNTNGGTWDLVSGPGNIDTLSGIINGTPGLYEVEYTTGGTCPNKDTLTVTLYAQPTAPVISSTKTIYCPGEALQPMSTTGTDSFAWYDDNSLSNPLASTTTFTPSTIYTGNNYFYLTSQDGNGCVSLPDSLNYILVDVSNMQAGPDQFVCTGSTVQLTASGGNTYQWNASSQIIDDLTLAEPQAVINVAEEFIVFITDTNGCVITDTTDVNLIPQDSCNIEVYNAFSPNNDGVNDFWHIDGIEGFPENSVVIYNRWGDPIISFENYNNADVIWDGYNKNNKEVPAGTYFYVVEVGGTRNQAGWIQVMR